MPIFPFVQPISFATILPIWRDALWPGRQSPILPVSTMVLFGGYDMLIRSRYTADARFFGIYNAEDLIGVFSGHPTSLTHFRGRGLYLRPDYHNLATKRVLVQAVVNAAADANRSICWSIARIANVPFFQACGYTPVSSPFTEGTEFGPSIYMTFPVRSDTIAALELVQ